MDDRRRRQLSVINHFWVALAFVLAWLHLPHVRGEWAAVVSPLTLYLIYVAVVLYAIARTLLVLNVRRVVEFDHLFLLIDAALIGLGVRLTGGLLSELALGYCALITTCALSLRVRFTLLVAALSVLCYLLATWHQRGNPIYPSYLATRAFFFALIGSIAGFIARQEQGARAREALLREELAVAHERTRIAREIHDGVGHALVGAVLQLEVCRRRLAEGQRDGGAEGQAAAILEEQAQALRHTLDEMREFVFHLKPAALGGEELAPALRQYVRRFAERTGTATELHAEDVLPPLSPAAQLATLRIMQEALTNVAKHARATQVQVELRADGGALLCLIRDNGIGFDPNSASKGSGLSNMRERAAALGGTLEIASAPGRGTQLRLALPAASALR